MKLNITDRKNHGIRVAWKFYLTLSLLLLLLGGRSYGQAKSMSIRLLDEINLKPVVGAHYIYGEQKGFSGQEGYITLDFDPTLSLNISHLEYGNLRFNPGDVEALFADGSLLLKPAQPRMLQPVSVFAVRRSPAEGVNLSLSDYDRLSHDAGSFLTRIPEIAVIQKSGNYGFDPVMRGFKYEQLNLVIDGTQSTLAACPNRMDPPASQISLNQMDRVEILKGPYFLRYGPSLGGTINFITPDPSFHEEFDPLARISTSYESNGSIFRTEGAAGFSQKDFMLGVNGSWSEGDDYKDGDGVVIPSGFSRGSLGGQLAYRLPGDQYLEMNITRNFARDVIFAALPMDLRKDDTWLVNARHQISVKDRKLKQWSTTAYLTHVSHLMDNLEKDLEPRTVNAITNATTRTFGGRTEGLLEYSLTRVYLGADLRVEEAKGIRTREMLAGPMAGKTIEDNVWQNGQIDKTALFAEYQLNHQPFEMVFSGRMEVNNARSRDDAPEFSDVYEDTKTVQFNPSLSMGIKNQLSESFSMGLWLGRSQRSGSLTERYINYFPVGLDPYELLGNPQIKPEINNQADIQFTYEKPRTILEVDVFAAYLQDFISSEIRKDLDPRLPSSPGVRQFINLDRALLTGFEMNWEQHLPGHLDLLMGMAYTYGQDLVHDEPLPEIAPLDLRAGLSGHFLKNVLRPEILFRHVRKQGRVDESYGETVSPGFSTMDLEITYDILKILHVAGGIRNLFDVAYYEHLNRSVRDVTQRPIYAPGRNFFLTVTLEIKD